ncbi:S24 family peptidase [Aquabacter sp. CN5-332]|uniref:XRE family transcriptional regulator n=1 Tax=Aquabacter sp. CN5-332 TaxID=3156608 RepID=UPI0032B429B0
MKELGRILRAARLRKNMVLREVAQSLKVSTSAVGQWERGEDAPSSDNLLRVCRLLGIDPGQALVGRMREMDHHNLTHDEHIDSMEVAARLDYDEVAPKQSEPPFEDAIAQIAGRMGGGSTGEVVTIQFGEMQTLEPVADWWRVPPGALRSLAGISAHHIAGWVMDGDSMEPTIKRTDVVFIDTRRRSVEADGIWAVDYGQGRTLKRIKVRRTGSNARWILSSDNPLYSSDEFDPDEVTIFGRYLFRFTQF